MSVEEFEQLPIVDENDIEVGTARRTDIHRRAWRHRAVHIIVVNSRGDVLLQRRSLMKETYPGFWDISVGGHVAVGESYEETAAREMREELGVDGRLTYLGKLPASAATGWEFVEIYLCGHEGPFVARPEEITELCWMDPGAILQRAALDRSWQITRSCVTTLRYWHDTIRKAGTSPGPDRRVR